MISNSKSQLDKEFTHNQHIVENAIIEAIAKEKEFMIINLLTNKVDKYIIARATNLDVTVIEQIAAQLP